MAPRTIALLGFVGAVDARSGLSLGSYRVLGDRQWLHGSDDTNKDLHDSSALATDFMDSYNRETASEFPVLGRSQEKQVSVSAPGTHVADIDGAAGAIDTTDVASADSLADPWAKLTGSGIGSYWSSWPWNKDGATKQSPDSMDSLKSAEQQGADDWASMKVVPKASAEKHSVDAWEEMPHSAAQERAQRQQSDSDSARTSRSQEMEDMLSRARAGTLDGDSEGVAAGGRPSAEVAPRRQRTFSAGPDEPTPVQGGQVVDIRLDSELQESMLRR